MSPPGPPRRRPVAGIRGWLQARLFGRTPWRRIANRPGSEPPEALLRQWCRSPWPHYARWLAHHGCCSAAHWRALRRTALAWEAPPRISVVTAAFRPDPVHLEELILSLKAQAYPFWELCIVDDGFGHPTTARALVAAALRDPRIRLRFNVANRGISDATNRAIGLASGEFVAFLDHDDRLAPDALFRVAESAVQDPPWDVLYSDRDMLDGDGGRIMHLLKPAWAPETLLSGNYLFHLLVYRRDLLQRLGGLRRAFDGSQDYDLILRASELTSRIRHLPRVLYHWRQHPGSVSLAHDSKAYAYDAGMRALGETLRRRGLSGSVSEIGSLWRGNYRLHLPRPEPSRIALCRLQEPSDYAAAVAAGFAANPAAELLVVLGPGVEPLDGESIPELTSWTGLPAVGFASGQLLDAGDRILHAGLVLRPDGRPLGLYRGFPRTEPGYMATTAIMHNVSIPHPGCVVIRRAAWEALGGMRPDYRGPHGLFDLALRAAERGWRCVYVPFARFCGAGPDAAEAGSEQERVRFCRRWAAWLAAGDPCYNPGLSPEVADCGLREP